MNINNIYNISFTSQKAEIKKADDIQRRAELVFPTISSSYVDNFYLSTGKTGRITEKKQSLFTHVCDLIYEVRKLKHTKSQSDKYIPYRESINAVKKIKAANCGEISHIILAALLANGYTNSQEASLKYKASLYDKKTQKHLYTGTISLDHTFVLTDMNKKTKEGRNIVVDGWLGFADSKSRALGRYKQMKGRRELDQALYQAVSDFRDCQYMHSDEIRDEYDVKENIFLQENRNLSEEDKKNLIEFMKENYPDVII